MQDVKAVMGQYTIDKTRVVAHGMGQGGQMAYYLGFNARDTFRGVAALGAVLGTAPKENVASQPLSFFIEGPLPDPAEAANKRARTRFLPDNVNDAIRLFKSSRFVSDLLGEQVQSRFAEVKQASAERCPRALGSLIKTAEVQFHHEVTNQYLWNKF
jgi:poly(3-hydroxybutyrate) depolymerase